MIWIMAVPFLLLGAIFMAGAATFALASVLDAIEEDIYAFRDSAFRFLMWVSFAAASFYLAAKVVV